MIWVILVTLVITNVSLWNSTFVTMEFGDRLRELMEEEDLSPAQLAEALGINRSAISHLVNNRNKPGFDIISKMRLRFEHWDFDYLLFGIKPSRAKRSTESRPEYDRSSERARRTQAIMEEERPETHVRPHASYQASLFSESSSAGNRTNDALPAKTSIQKRVTRTILIYSDGTFEIFSNKKQMLCQRDGPKARTKMGQSSSLKMTIFKRKSEHES